jgi:outer membrane protein
MDLKKLHQSIPPAYAARLHTAICLAVVISLTSHPLQAQSSTPEPATQPFTLAQVWDSIMVNAKLINMERLRVLSAAEYSADLKLDRLPDISASAAYSKLSNLLEYQNGLFNQSTRFPIAHTAYNLGASAYFNLFDGHRLNNNLKKAKINEDIQNQQVHLTLEDTRLLAAGYYLDLIRDQKFAVLLEQDIAEQKKVVVQIKAFYKSGVVLKSDVLRAELKISKQLLQLHQIEDQLALNSQKLNLLMGRPETVLISPQDELNTDSLQLDTYEEYLNRALSQAYEISISANEKNLKAIGLKEAKANVLPQLGLYADYGLNYPQGRLYPYAPSLYGLGSVGFKASYPLSALYKNRHKVTMARLNIHKEELKHGQLEDEIRNKTRAGYLALKEDMESIRVSRSNILQTTENLRILKNSYFNQTALMTDYLDADLQLLQSRFDLAAAQVAAQYHCYQLKKIFGQL